MGETNENIMIKDYKRFHEQNRAADEPGNEMSDDPQSADGFITTRNNSRHEDEIKRVVGCVS